MHKNSSGYLTSINKLTNKNYSINTYDKMFKTYKYSNCRKSNLIKDNSIKNKTNNLFNNKSLNRYISGVSFVQGKNNNSNFNNYYNNKLLYTLIKKK